MTPFHLKLYYLLADKNTQVGQTGSGGHHHHGGGHYSKNRGNNSGQGHSHHGGLKAAHITHIDQVHMPKKLLVLTNQQEVKESRQAEARKLNVSLIGKKKKKALEQCHVGTDESQTQSTSLLDYCAERASGKVKDKRFKISTDYEKQK